MNGLDQALPYDARVLDNTSRAKVGEAMERYGVKWNGGLPLFVLLDADGEPLMSFSGGDYVEDLEKNVAALFEQAQ